MTLRCLGSPSQSQGTQTGKNRAVSITLPEVRSTALSIESLIESAGAALSPLIAGFIADRSSLGTAILLICVSTWLLCALFFIGVAIVVSGDIRTLRTQMQVRAAAEQGLQRVAL